MTICNVAGVLGVHRCHGCNQSLRRMNLRIVWRVRAARSLTPERKKSNSWKEIYLVLNRLISSDASSKAMRVLPCAKAPKKKLQKKECLNLGGHWGNWRRYSRFYILSYTVPDSCVHRTGRGLFRVRCRNPIFCPSTYGATLQLGPLLYYY